MNAALLVTHGGTAHSPRHLTSSALGAPGAFGYSKGTYLNLTDSTVTTTGNNSPALETAERAMMKVVNTTVSTSGYASPAMKVSQNGGMILAESSHFTTTGKDSLGAIRQWRRHTDKQQREQHRIPRRRCPQQQYAFP